MGTDPAHSGLHDSEGGHRQHTLDKGTDYNGTRQYRGTPMNEAVGNDDEKIIGLLLEKDAK